MGTSSGLSSSEAKELLAKYGPNEIISKSRHTFFEILISQFTSILIILLIIATLASFALGEIIDGIFISLIIILNGVLGFIQEYRAEKAIEALNKMAISSVRVIRDGQEQAVDSKFLVSGDVIILEEGDKIPADGKLVDSLHFEVNEASLTGESMPVSKRPEDPEKENIYLGTIVVKGRAKAVVTETGMRTRFGKIATSLSKIEEEETPLAKKLNVLGKQLGVLAIMASGVVFILGFIAQYPLFDMILTSISLAVASVPEGLPAIITITLAVGMQRMAKQKAIMRKLSAVEALGGATIIATDKTGTLTRNEMKVVKIWMEGNNFDTGDKKLNAVTKTFEKLIIVSSVCNNASLAMKHGYDSYTVLGDTTEGALLLLATEYNYSPDQVKKKGELIEEFDFDPVLKTMTVIWRIDHQVYGLKSGSYVLTKGAPETILANSTHLEEGGKVKNLNEKDKENIDQSFREFAKKGLRVIALAYRQASGKEKDRDKVEKKMIFLGFVGIADPPRKEVGNSIRKAEKAGIRTIMITGDNELTAHTIATQIGLIKEGEEVVTGNQLEKFSDEELMMHLGKIRIFARATPEHKLRIVRLLQKKGQVVAVTGDGVNDALALKQADIGVAMGITGTDVAKEASDMVITDDNYATIVRAVEEGRTIFDNIKSSIKYLIGCNIGEVLAILGGMLIGVYLNWPIILTPLQILYVNLVTDGLPALALAVEPKREKIMDLKPRRNKSIFDPGDKYWFSEVSLLTGIATITSFFIGWKFVGNATGRALAFTTVILVQHFIFIDVWVRKESFLQPLAVYKNKMFLLAFFLPLIIHPFLIYNSTLASIFKITSTPIWLLILTVSLSSIVLFSSEIRKLFLDKRPYT